MKGFSTVTGTLNRIFFYIISTAAIAAHAYYNPADPFVLKPREAEVLVDRKYILAAMGLLSTVYPDTALRIMKRELIKDGI